jgi:hypothetical protein
LLTPSHQLMIPTLTSHSSPRSSAIQSRSLTLLLLLLSMTVSPRILPLYVPMLNAYGVMELI